MIEGLTKMESILFVLTVFSMVAFLATEYEEDRRYRRV